MVILEGSDCVGKTTLANMLLEQDYFQSIGARYGHLSRLPDDHDRLLDYKELIDPLLIQDRFHMSEIAYCAGRQELFENVKLTPHMYELIDAWLRLVGAVTVVILAPPSLITERHAANREREMYDVQVSLIANGAFTSMVNGKSPYDVDFDMVIDAGLMAMDEEYARDIVDLIIDTHHTKRTLLLERGLI
jgi:hypothetical protein